MKKEDFSSYLELDLNSAKNFANKNSIIPSELFKYTKVRNAKDLLYDNIMYLPQLSELNDMGHCCVMKVKLEIFI